MTSGTLDWLRGRLALAWGSVGFIDGLFNSALAVAVDRDGKVLVTDDNHRVQRFACPPAAR